MPGITRIESNVPVAPPGWAAMERRLLDTLSEAAVQYVDRYTSGGTLTWKTTGGLLSTTCRKASTTSPCCTRWAVTIGCVMISFREWNATARQLTYDFHILHHEFGIYGDWFHFGEGMEYFYLLSLVDPTTTKPWRVPSASPVTT